MSPEREHDASTKDASLEGLHQARLAAADVSVVSGPDLGVSLAVGSSGLLVGTGTACDLRLSDDLVSRRHVELFAEAAGVRVIDRGSRNGTFLADARIYEVLLARDANLRVGASVLALRLQQEPLEISFSPNTRFGDAVAQSQAMRHAFSLLEVAAKSNVTVLLEGESGTGKDVLAHALHEQSARREGPFVVVDCGAIPAGLVESELFGHEKGAFTGAVAARAGAFEQADGGTIFLDEIGELPLEAQPKLLRVLESRASKRVGGTRATSFDVRVIAATNRRLRESIRRKEFREDLFYRLAVVHVAVPRLADRKEDIIPLAERFLRRATGRDDARVPDDLARLLLSYHWPGNARELRNVIERFSTFDRADANVLFSSSADNAGAHKAEHFDLLSLANMPYHDAKRRLVEAFHRVVLPTAVAREGGSVARAAEALELPRASLYRMMQGLGEDDED